MTEQASHPGGEARPDVVEDPSAVTAARVDAADTMESVEAVETDPGDQERRVASRVARLEREGEVAADFLETLLDIADLDGDIDVDVEGDRAVVSIVDSEEGRVPRRLVGQDGEVMEALQELTRLAVQASTGERSRLLLDVAQQRAARREVLRARAATAISEARASGAAQRLEPMSAFERKVVHDEVLAAGLVSQSEGTEPHRHVIVLPE
jgi:spoIIIJ-associated protein